jgi:Phosphoglycerol transferase and related proteins, alkaline phosphatase superfamily
MFEERKLKTRKLKLPKPAFVLEILLWLEFISAIFIKCFYFQFTTNLNVIPFFSAVNKNMMLAVVTSILFIIALLIIIFNKKRLIALFVINILLSLLLFADTVYFRYYYCALSVPVLYQLGLVGSLSDSIMSLLKIRDIVFAIDIPFVFAFLLLFKYKFKLKAESFHIVKRLISAFVVTAISIVLFQFAYGSSSPGTFPYDNNYVSNNLGVLYFHYYDVKKYMKENVLVDKRLSAEETAKIVSFYNEKATGIKYKGIAKGKNLVVVQMEAAQQFIINKKIEGKEITPNLNKFINDSAYFENFYSQIGGGNTSDAEFLTNTSLYPMQDGSVYFRFPTDTFESTAKLLKNQGYSTYVAHANNPSFWNRAEMYKSLGFERFINSKNYKIDEYIGWGLSDKSFFKQTLEKLDTSKPFYSFLITLSSHHPFNFFQDYGDFNVGKYDKTFIGNYIKAAHYLDESLGTFFDDLKRRGLYDSSVIVIYGDHSAIPQDSIDSDVKEFLNYTDTPYNWLKLQRTPCFIRFPGMDNKGVQKVTVGEIDILPTVANLLGIEVPHAMGKDMFNTEKGYAVLRSASVVTDDFVYSNSTRKIYDVNGNGLDLKNYEDIIKQYQDQLLISDSIIKKNALTSDKLK